MWKEGEEARHDLLPASMGRAGHANDVEVASQTDLSIFIFHATKDHCLHPIKLLFAEI